jgi:hypothetical protein
LHAAHAFPAADWQAAGITLNKSTACRVTS